MAKVDQITYEKLLLYEHNMQYVHINDLNDRVIGRYEKLYPTPAFSGVLPLKLKATLVHRKRFTSVF